MSFPEPGLVVEIDRTSGMLVGQYGTRMGSFAFAPPLTTPPTAWSFGFQHFPNYTEAGTLLVSSHMPGYEETSNPVANQHAFIEFAVDKGVDPVQPVSEDGTTLVQLAEKNGAIDLALIKYDREESAESLAAGAGPCIHHFAIEVDDFDKSVAEIKKLGCEIISDPGVVPVKFRAPGGTVAEIVPTARYKKPN